MRPQTSYYQTILRRFSQYYHLLGYRASCLSGLAEFLGQLEQGGILALEQIESSHIKAHYAYLRERPSQRGGALSLHTIQGYLFEIRLFLRWAEKTKIITSSPMQNMRFPSPPASERAILSKLEIALLYNTCKVPLERVLLSLFYGCGLRVSEGVKLNLKDVDTRSALLYVRSGKGRKRRVIPLTASIIQDVSNYLIEQRPQQVSPFTQGDHQLALVLNQRGRRHLAESYRRGFKRILAIQSQLRQDVSLHSLRHSIATHLLADGMAIERVRDFLGHDCLESTQIYTHIKTEQL